MRIRSFELTDNKTGWKFPKVTFGRINLLVGDSATGKTKFLNTIFNVARFAGNHIGILVDAVWTMEFAVGKDEYRWKVETSAEVNDKVIVNHEELWKCAEGGDVPIIQRENAEFTFDKRSLPKLSKRESGISLLKEEDLVAPVYEAFGVIKRRSFFSGELEKAGAFGAVSLDFLKVIGEQKRSEMLKSLFGDDLTLSCRLYILSRHLPDSYREICDRFKAVFPFVSEIDIRPAKASLHSLPSPSVMPVFCIKERHVQKWIEIHELSSGMQKVLLVITDVLTMPEGALYIIDEYENSLGINAIDFFPQLLLDTGLEHQFIITSHHPYLINNIPTKDWFVFHRKGSEVRVQQGEEVAKKFGTSKQKAFTQLINDSFYTEGIE